MGISGGKRKIKSKDVLDMKKVKKQQIGGQGLVHTQTNPTDRTYIPVGTTGYPSGISDQAVIDAFRYCESSHRLTTPTAGRYATYGVANTSTNYDLQQLRDCIGNQLFGNYTSAYARASRTMPTLPAGSTFPGYCTYGTDDRRACPPSALPVNPSLASISSKSVRFGGKRSSRKKNPRSSVKRATVKK